MTSVFFLIPTNRVGVSCIDLHGCGNLQVFSFILLFSRIFPLLFFTILFRDFCVSVVIVWACSLAILGFRLRFLILRIFYSIFLSLDIKCSCVDRIIFLLVPMVHFSDIKGRLEARVGLDFNCFLNNFFLSINFSPFLLHLGLN